MLKGFEQMEAADLFDLWFAKLGLSLGRKLIPVAHNWPHDRGFILDWLGPKNFEDKFHYHARDTQTITVFENDRAYFHGEAYPYPKHTLSYVCNILKVPLDHGHDALADAVATGEAYRRICRDNITTLQQGILQSQAEAIKDLVARVPDLDPALREKYLRLTEVGNVD
jgi:DNA polymerase III epsilon subunit-like protein